MKNLNDTLPELMRRATENLEPESTDLVERGMARGVTLRRRRTALFTLTGATAVLATAGVIVGGTQLFANDAQPPAASTTTKQLPANVATKPATPKETLATLLKLLPPRFTVSKTQSWDDGLGNQADVMLNDGKGLSELGLAVRAPGFYKQAGCDLKRVTGHCAARPDGSVLTVTENEPRYGKDIPGALRSNEVVVIRRGTESISLTIYNGTTQNKQVVTRPKPALTVAELTAIADSDLWRFPAKPKPEATSTGPVKPEPTNPGTSKPPVPVQQTLQTLKAVLPNGLQVTQPATRGGTPEDYNAASVLVNDGRGKSYVEAFVSYEVPVAKKCGEERATTYCNVRSDGAVVGWNKNSPEYSDSRQNDEGVLSNYAEIHYPDGRYINLTSYNAVAEKGSKHTRATPAISAEKLLSMAGSSDWKFPGTKK